jgi:hypothetical protein
MAMSFVSQIGRGVARAPSLVLKTAP